MKKFNLLLFLFVAFRLNAQNVAQMPYYCNFEDSASIAGWMLTNGNQTSRWCIGSAVNDMPSGVNCLYISADSGATHSFGDTMSYVFASRTLYIDSGEYLVSYDWRGKLPRTSPTWPFRNCLRAALVPGVASFTAGDNGGWQASSVPSAYISVDSTGGFCGTYDWTHYRQRVHIDSSGTYTLAFLFNYTRYNTYTTIVPPAIDNISVEPVTCPMVDTLTVTAQADGILLSWNQTSASSWIVDWNGSTMTVDHPFIVVEGIGMGRTDTAYITPICGTDTGFYEQFTVTQPCDSIRRLPYFQHFDDLDIDWTSEFFRMPYCWNRLCTNESPNDMNFYPSLRNWFGVGGSPCLYWTMGSSNENRYAVLPPVAEALGPMDSIVVSFEAKRFNYWSSIEVGVMTDPYDSTTFVPVATVNVQYDNFSEHSVPLTGYTGTGRYVAFRMIPGGTLSSFQAYTIVMDNVGLSKISDCVPPVSVVKHPYPDHIDLSWTPGNGENRWIVYCNGVASDYILNNEYTISNLQPGTEYMIDIVSDCNNDENSLPRHFMLRTKCQPLDIPYSYGFDGSEFDQCWYKSSSWPELSNGMLRFEPLWNRYSYTVLPIYPASVDSLEFSFALMQDTIQVGVVDDPYDISSFVPIRTMSKSRNGVWERYYCYFGDYSGTGRYLAFRSPSTGYTGQFNDAFIDDVEVNIAPSCPTPDTYRLLAHSHDSATFSWYGQGVSNFELRIVNLENGSSQTIYTQTNLATVTGLMPATDYTVYIRAICDSGDTSIALTGGFRTFAAPANVPYACGFDSACADGWTLVNGNYTNRWYIGQAAYNDTADHRGLYISDDDGQSNTYTISATSAVLAVRNFTLQAGYYNFSYDWRVYVPVTYGDYLCVALFPDSVLVNEAAGFVGTWYNNHTPESAIALDDYVEYVMNCDGSWHTRSGQIIVPSSGGWILVFYWRNNNVNGFNPPAAIDNVFLDINSCPAASNLTYSNVTHNSVQLDWIENGDATSWRVEYGPHGFTPGDGSFHTYFNHPCTLSNLSPSTTYDIYVRPICSDSQFVFYTGPVTITTGVCAQPNIVEFADSSNYNDQGYVPVLVYAPYSASVMLLDSSQLNGPQDYEGLRFFYASETPLSVKNDIDIYLQPTRLDHFSYSDAGLFDSTTAQMVYSGPFNFSYGWNTVAFDSVYSYLGDGNILMIILDNSGSSQGDAAFGGYTDYGGKCMYFYDLSQSLSPSALSVATGYPSSTMPFLQLYSCTPYCAPVAELAVDTVGYDFASVSWNGDAVAYEVTLSLLDADDQETVMTAYTDHITFTGLVPTSRYRCSVRSICDSAEGRYSQARAVTFMTDTLLCDAPSGLTVSEIGYTSALFDWQTATDEGQWILHIWNTAFDTSILTSEHPVLFEGLAQDLGYYATVRAYCGGGILESENSNTVHFSTLTCPQVEELQVSNITQTSAVVTWQSSTETCTVEYGPHNFRTGQGTLVSGVSGGRINIGNLTPGVYYDVNVRSNCGNGVSSRWTTVTFQTDANGITTGGDEPSIVISPNPASHSATLSISGVSGHIEVDVCDLGGRIVYSHSLDCGGDCQVRLNVKDLKPGSYFVRVKSKGVNIVKKLVRICV